jgi:hypothetical protein
MAKNPETILSNFILESLRKKYVNSYWFKNVVASVTMPSGFKSTVGAGKGSCDLMGCVNADGKGLFVALEVKCPGKDLADHQVDWIKQFRKSGGVAERVDCIQAAFRVVDGVIDGTYKETYLGLSWVDIISAVVILTHHVYL